MGTSRFEKVNGAQRSVKCSQMLQECRNHIRFVVYMTMQRYPNADREELLSCAHLGFMEAWNKFQPRAGSTFWAFARRRVLGAMRDFIRKDGSSLTFRRRGGKWVQQPLEVGLTFEPAVAPLDPTRLFGPFRHRVDELSSRQKFVLKRYYWDEDPLQEIGKEMGCSESRVSQIKREAVARLRGTAARSGPNLRRTHD